MRPPGGGVIFPSRGGAGIRERNFSSVIPASSIASRMAGPWMPALSNDSMMPFISAAVSFFTSYFLKRSLTVCFCASVTGLGAGMPPRGGGTTGTMTLVVHNLSF